MGTLLIIGCLGALAVLVDWAGAGAGALGMCNALCYIALLTQSISQNLSIGSAYGV